MIKYVKLTAEFIGSVLSYLWSTKATEMMQAVVSHLYTGYVKRHFVIAYKALRIKGTENISIGQHVQIGKGIQLTAWSMAKQGSDVPMITIGDHCTIRENSHITSSNRISIGNNLLTGTNVLITDNSHGQSNREHMSLPFTERPIYSKGPVHIGNNVWLGNNVCVMPNVTIGDSAVIGANSVVTHNIPPYCVAAGIPAKVIKQL